MLIRLIAAVAALSAVPAAAQTVSGCGTVAIAKSDAGSLAKLAAGADCFGRARAIAAAAEQVRRDRIVAITPAPMPSPMPRPTGTPALAPSLAGVDAIPSNFDPAPLLQPAWGSGAIPASNAPDVVGAFRFVCAAGQLSYDDPIMYPGQPGKAHLHQFFGNLLADAWSVYDTLRTSGESTCNNMLNRSAYWIPAMMTPAGKVVKPNFVTVYYKRRPATDPACTIEGAACIALPRGLRYIFGYSMVTGAMLGSAEIGCADARTSGVGGFARSIPEAAKACPADGYLYARLSAPSCWDGKHLDTPDHYSHMAYPSWGAQGEQCPADHPYVVPTFTIAAFYRIDASLDRTGGESWFLSSDRMPGMARQVPGSTFHSDWFGAWDDAIMQAWTANCINRLLNCSGGDLGDGRQLTPLHGYDAPSGTVLVDPPAR